MLEEGRRLLAGQYPGGLISTKVASFTSPQMTKVLDRDLLLLRTSVLRKDVARD